MDDITYKGRTVAVGHYGRLQGKLEPDGQAQDDGVYRYTDSLSREANSIYEG